MRKALNWIDDYDYAMDEWTEINLSNPNGDLIEGRSLERKTIGQIEQTNLNFETAASVNNDDSSNWQLESSDEIKTLQTINQHCWII